MQQVAVWHISTRNRRERWTCGMVATFSSALSTSMPPSFCRTQRQLNWRFTSTGVISGYPHPQKCNHQNPWDRRCFPTKLCISMQLHFHWATWISLGAWRQRIVEIAFLDAKHWTKTMFLPRTSKMEHSWFETLTKQYSTGKLIWNWLTARHLYVLELFGFIWGLHEPVEQQRCFLLLSGWKNHCYGEPS